MAIPEYVLFNARRAGARIGAEGGAHAGHLVMFHYRHRDLELLADAVVDLAPHNGTAAGSYGPLVVLIAAAMRPLDGAALASLLARWTAGAPVANLHALLADALRQCATEASREALARRPELPASNLQNLPLDLRARGPRTARSVASLWSEFFATGDREVVRTITTALEAWHPVVRALRAKQEVPDERARETPGYAASWSLASLGRKHARVRALVREARDDLSLPLAVREELARIAGDHEAALAEGPDPVEPAVEALVRSRGVAVLTWEPPALAPTEPLAAPEGPLPTLGFLDPLPAARWQEALAERWQDPASIAKTLALAALAAPTGERARASFEASLALAGAGLFALASEGFAREGALSDDDAERAYEKARFAAECADRASLWPRAEGFLSLCLERHEALHPGLLTVGSSDERTRHDLLRWRSDVARRAQGRERRVAALEGLIESLELRLASRPRAEDQHALGSALLERATLDPAGAEVWLVRAVAELERAHRDGAPAAADLGTALLHRALGWVRAGRAGGAVGYFDQAIERLDEAAATGDGRSLGSSLEARAQRALALQKAGEAELAHDAARDALERMRALVGEGDEARPWHELARWMEKSLGALAEEGPR